jgi:hypothetical protein
MPRRSKGARLWLRPARRNKAGKVTRHAIWLILDGGKHFATGCAQNEADRAEQILAEYIARKYHPDRRQRDLEEIDVADVLSIYLDDCADRHANQKRFRARIARLNDFWGGMALSNVTGSSCRRYARHRANPGGARRDLEDLRAAINHHAKEGLHRGVVRIVLPDKGPARDRWLTRSEAGALLWACWRTREIQTLHRGAHKGEKIATSKYPLRHIARFLLIGLYTGTRAGALAASSPSRGDGRSFVDLEQGIFYRLAQGKRATNKPQPPVPLPPRLLSHMRRWARLGIAKDYFVGKSIRQGHAPCAPAHGCDVAHASGRANMGGSRVPWHVAGSARPRIWASSPRTSAGCRARPGRGASIIGHFVGRRAQGQTKSAENR